LGSLNGVNSTRAVWVGEKEVVHLTYDPNVIDYKTLLAYAGQLECTAAVYTYDDQQYELASKAKIDEVVPWDDSLETRQVKKAEQKYYLRNTVLAYLPLTELQAVKMNAALTQEDKGDVTSYLSPRQRQLLKRIQRMLKQDEQALDGFGFPEDPSNLVAYHQKLIAKLDQLEK